MNVDVLEGFSQSRFLTEYWQKKPCVISNWLRPEARPLSELLDLAEAHDLPIRLVSGNLQRADWHLEEGPLTFEDLPQCRTDWTVLIQEMDKASPGVARLLDQFRFLPDWAIDDIMISDAVDGGSVGPHVDAYDVFLVQAAGQRRWELAGHFDPSFDEGFALRVLRSWQPETLLTLEPGQALYLPAGIAHHGIAIGHCQTWSVGLRTPSGPELMFALAEALVGSGKAELRMPLTTIDPDQPSMIGADELSSIRDLLSRALVLSDEELAAFSAGFLSRWRLWQDEAEPLESAQVLQWLRAGQTVPLAPGARLAVTEIDGSLRLYLNGDWIACHPDLAKALAATRSLTQPWQFHRQAIEQLCELDALTRPEAP